MLKRTTDITMKSNEFQSDVALRGAIGYLALWAIGSDRYAHVYIYVDDAGDAFANYRAAPGGAITYQIGAIRDASDPANVRYSFHS